MASHASRPFGPLEAPVLSIRPQARTHIIRPLARHHYQAAELSRRSAVACNSASAAPRRADRTSFPTRSHRHARRAHGSRPPVRVVPRARGPMFDPPLLGPILDSRLGHHQRRQAYVERSDTSRAGAAPASPFETGSRPPPRALAWAWGTGARAVGPPAPADPGGRATPPPTAPTRRGW